MEIITGVERRRRWRLEEKLRLVAECDAPGGSVTRVAHQHDISRALLWNWWRQFRERACSNTPSTPEFLPVSLASQGAATHAGIEIHFPTGRGCIFRAIASRPWQSA
ncbi:MULTISPECIES: IS66 family insertion sequence element accessory protein TnpA [Acetobacter]|uniref:IS66 family insertion sequence element accessory protein TnpA n=1 Tax=Acetobacter TaxID=434 RepID=UPI001656B58D|nr:transposase [Acetobacter tropicalis]MBC9008953.1 transposase [Acetobacter tropicalis]